MTWTLPQPRRIKAQEWSLGEIQILAEAKVPTFAPPIIAPYSPIVDPVIATVVVQPIVLWDCICRRLFERIGGDWRNLIARNPNWRLYSSQWKEFQS